MVSAIDSAPEAKAWPGTAPPGHKRPAAVLVPLYERDGEPIIVLTRRSMTMSSHQGDVSFPGGRLEEGESAIDAALRETNEEIALELSQVSVIGELDHLQTIASSAGITPIVGLIDGLPDLRPQPSEVDEILHVPVADLLKPDIYHEELWDWEGAPRPLWFFDLGEDTVWGATAAILRNLLSLSVGVRRGHPYARRPGWLDQPD